MHGDMGDRCMGTYMAKDYGNLNSRPISKWINPHSCRISVIAYSIYITESIRDFLVLFRRHFAPPPPRNCFAPPEMVLSPSSSLPW